MKYFSSTQRRRNLTTQQSPAAEKLHASARWSVWVDHIDGLQEAPFSKCFPSTLKRKADVNF